MVREKVSYGPLIAHYHSVHWSDNRILTENSRLHPCNDLFRSPISILKMRTMNARSIQCLAAVKFNGRDSYLESRMLKVGIFPSLSAPVGSEGKREQWSTFLLEIKPNCPFSLVVP